MSCILHPQQLQTSNPTGLVSKELPQVPSVHVPLGTLHVHHGPFGPGHWWTSGTAEVSHDVKVKILKSLEKKDKWGQSENKPWIWTYTIKVDLKWLKFLGHLLEYYITLLGTPILICTHYQCDWMRGLALGTLGTFGWCPRWGHVWAPLVYPANNYHTTSSIWQEMGRFLTDPHCQAHVATCPGHLTSKLLGQANPGRNQ